MAKPANELDLTQFARERADDNGGTGPAPSGRTFTEGEAYALVADNVARETAAAKASIDELTSEKADLQTKLDVAEAALETEKTAREKAEQDFQAYKQEQETAREVAARTDERTSKVREVAQHLKDEFFTPERAARWAAMDDEAFTAYVAELAAVSAPAGSTTVTAPTGQAPRETAMAGQPAGGAGGGDAPSVPLAAQLWAGRVMPKGA